MALHAVLAAIPETTCANTPECVAQQRCYAAAALGRSAALSGAPPHGYRKSEEGAPLVNDGWHWSVSHKRHWAAAIVARERVGIDVEAIVPRSEDHFNEIATPAEWACFSARDPLTFFRVWTAKEAVVKSAGFGVGRMDACRITSVPQIDMLHAELDGVALQVVHFGIDEHLASVACIAGAITWHVVRDLPTGEIEAAS